MKEEKKAIQRYDTNCLYTFIERKLYAEIFLLLCGTLTELAHSLCFTELYFRMYV